MIYHCVTGHWLARKQGMPTVTTPFRTEQEIELFLELLPQHESTRGKVNYEKLAEAFNSRVIALIKSRTGVTCAATTSSGDKLPFDVYLKTAKYVKEYCCLLKKRMILQKTCAEWVENLKAVRRALREDSFCSWCPAAERGIGRGRPDRPSESQQHQQQESQQQHAVALLPQPGEDGGNTTASSAMAAASAAFDASESHVIRGKKKRAPKHCQTCKKPLTYAPKGYEKAPGSEYHTKFGWCPTSQSFVSKGKCKLCGNIRAEDPQHHEPGGYCARMKAYVSNSKLAI